MEKLKGNILIAQSGGPTAVINSSVCGIIQEAMKYNNGIYGAINGILGVLQEKIIDLKKEKKETIELLKQTPASALGSCRYKLKETDYEKIMDVLKKHNIRYFFIAGGNDSMDTANKVNKLAQSEKYELYTIGIPKTVDNDLPITDHCPGYGSVARWLAIAVRDAGLDTEAIYTSDTIKIIETMGRNAGWITASTCLANEHQDAAPHLIYLPERIWDINNFLKDVDRIYTKLGYVLITCCEGLIDKDGNYLAASKKTMDTDEFGHKQLGGVGEFLVDCIASNLKLKARCDKPGTIQRASSLCASSVDVQEAYLVGQTAVKEAVNGKSGYMVTLQRENSEKYQCRTSLARLEDIANKVRKVPDEFINAEGNYVTDKFIDYIKPLIGEPLPKYAYFDKHFI